MISIKGLIKIIEAFFCLLLLVGVTFIGRETIVQKHKQTQKESATAQKNKYESILGTSTSGVGSVESLEYNVPVTFGSDAIFNGNIIINGEIFKPESVVSENIMSGMTNIPINTLLYSSGSEFVSIPSGERGYLLVSNGSGSLPSWASPSFVLGSGDVNNLFFSEIRSGENSDAEMIIGNDASLSYKGGTRKNGSINASLLEGNTWENPGIIGFSNANMAKFSDLFISGKIQLISNTEGVLIADNNGQLLSTSLNLNSKYISGVLSVAYGGTGASMAAEARVNLGLGSMATESKESYQTLNLAGENINGILPLAYGGTGASMAAEARVNLGLGSMATESKESYLSSDYFNKEGGSISGDLMINDSSPKINFNGMQILYLPDQTKFLGSLAIGNGGQNLQHSSGDDGRYNTFMGLNAGYSNTTGYYNLALGAGALQANTTGNFNSAFGVYSMYFNSTGSNNLAIAKGALFLNQNGNDNSALGVNSLFSTMGSNNVGIGTNALFNNAYASNNIGIGRDSGFYSQNGQNNIFIGKESGRGTALYTLANNNIAIGFQAGYNIQNSSSNNIFIGNQAGYGETGSNKLYIANSSTANPLIYGDFASNLFEINGKLKIGTGSSNFALDVENTNSATAAALINNNSEAATSSGLIIKLGNISNDYVNNSNHFISFETKGLGIVGSIQGNQGKGIQLAQNGIADYAEYMPKDQDEEIPFGSLLCIEISGKVKACTKESHTIVGISSEHPLIIAGENLGESSIAVGLTGIVNTRVSSLNGIIKPGDHIAVSNIPGVGVKAIEPGMIAGTAIQGYDGSVNDIGEILLTVNPGWNGTGGALSSDSGISEFIGTFEKLQNIISDKSLTGNFSVSGKTLLSDLSVTGKINNGLLVIEGLGLCGNKSACNEASINTLSGNLRLQSAGVGGLDILNGKVLIDRSGDITILGEVKARKYAVETEDKETASMGDAILPKGETSVKVESKSLTLKSSVFLTALDKIQSPIFILGKEINKSFTVGIAKPEEKDIHFSWWIIN